MFDTSRILPNDLELVDYIDSLIMFSEFFKYPSKKKTKKALKMIKKMKRLVEEGKTEKLFRKDAVKS